MENSEVFTLEVAKTPLSPNLTIKPKSFSVQAIDSVKTPNNNSIASFSCLQATSSTVCLETLQEVSRNNDDLVSEMDSICFEDQSLNLSNISVKRKRKFVSPDNTLIKRKREKCCSERRKRVSSFFKTPINYFSNRRRTIDASSFNHSLNESAASNSGVFNVETVENLSVCIESDTTPRGSMRKSKKNLFTRTFSSSRFTRSKSKLNSSKLSFNEEPERGQLMNASCFPDISLRSKPSQSRHQSDCGSELVSASRRTSALAVLTSIFMFHVNRFYERTKVTFISLTYIRFWIEKLLKAITDLISRGIKASFIKF